MSMTLAPEAVLGGRYRLVHRLACGGMGQVWRAADEVLGRPVAVKLLRSEYAEDRTFLERFRTEARRTAALTHPGIAGVFDYGEIQEPDITAYLVMELVDGAPLSALLARVGRLDPDRALNVIAQAALALGAAHRAGLVHRDVKPSNLLIRRDGVVKVTDFGISRAVDEAPRSETGLVVGTAAYLSPEQVACRPATPASDVYALGVVAYECLAGRRPFTGEHPIALALAHHRHRPPPLPPDVPQPARALVELAMAKDPRARPQSATELARHTLAARAALIEGRPWKPGEPAIDPDGPAAWHASVPLGWPTPGADGDGPGTGARAGNGHGPSVANGHGPGANGHKAAAASVEQETGEWTPVSLLVGRAWSWSRRQRPLAVAAVVAVLALIAVALTAATSQSPPTVPVPSVDGLPIATAGQALAKAGFVVRERTQASRSIEADVVLSQEPAAGIRLPKGGRVTLVVSTGPAPVAVDPARYLGKPLDAVRGALIRLELRVIVETEPATGGEPGMVVGLDPSGALRQGDSVTITVTPVVPPPGPAASAEPTQTPNGPSAGKRSEKAAHGGKHGGHGKHGD
jgi:eukaryotic-like serine/threonine-protein kinase